MSREPLGFRAELADVRDDPIEDRTSPGARELISHLLAQAAASEQDMAGFQSIIAPSEVDSSAAVPG